MNNLTAMILAGGRGKRMGTLCDNRSKPCLPFAGYYRVIDFCLSNCLNSGVEQVAVLVDYQRENMIDYLGLWQAQNLYPSRFDVLPPKNVSYSGTANAFYQNLDYLSAAEESILVLASDHIYKMDYRRMLESHLRTDADVTIAVNPVSLDKANQFGILTTDSAGNIVSFQEKPEQPQTNLASMGIYIFKKSVLIRRLIEDSGISDSVHDFGHSILPRMVSKDSTMAYQFKGYWRDIGTVKAYYEANMEMLQNPAYLSPEDDWPVYTFSRYASRPIDLHQTMVEVR